MIIEGEFGELESIIETPLPELATGSIPVATRTLKEGLPTPKRATIEYKYDSLIVFAVIGERLEPGPNRM